MDRRIRPVVKRLLAATLFHSGVLSALAKIRLRREAVVLTYHRVLPRAEIDACPSSRGIVVGLESFESQMRQIRKRFNPVSLKTFIGHLRTGERFPARTCLVTFDDGWADNFTHAYPVLRKYDIPAVVFLAAGFIGTVRRFWQETLVDLVLSARDECDRDPDFLTRLERDPELDGIRSCLRAPRKECTDSALRFVASLKPLPEARVLSVTERLEKLLPDEREPVAAARQFLSWEEVAEMARGGIEFGCHGVNHRILTRPEIDAAREIAESQDMLERKLGVAPESFCYPNGEFSSDTVKLVRARGFRAAFSTNSGSVAAGSDPFTLSRRNISENATRTVALFMARVLGLW